MIEGDRGVRWGILGTANIARGAFLPALRAAGGGEAVAVAGRDRTRTEEWARQNAVSRAVDGYEALIADGDIDAMYNPLPNSLHAEWTIAALRAGKSVLCEKPLCLTAEEAERVLDVARESQGYLWEAFVFPYGIQWRRLTELVAGGAIGEVREVDGTFYFRIGDPGNIRLDPNLGGGALYDVGCYPIRFTQLLFGAGPDEGSGLATWTERGVDMALQGLLGYSGERRALISCGMDRSPDTFCRVLGSEGEIRLTNPYHANADDTLEIRTQGGTHVERAASGEPSFTAALRHIDAVLHGRAQPEHLAVDDSLPTAEAIDLLYDSARENRNV